MKACSSVTASLAIPFCQEMAYTSKCLEESKHYITGRGCTGRYCTPSILSSKLKSWIHMRQRSRHRSAFAWQLEGHHKGPRIEDSQSLLRLQMQAPQSRQLILRFWIKNFVFIYFTLKLFLPLTWKILCLGS